MDKLINDFKISFTKGDTYALAIKFKNLSEDLRTAFFTVKENPDDEPLIQKSLGAGIDKIDDREYKNEKTYKLQIQATDTAYLEAHVQYLYDLQVSVGNVVKTVISGVFVVTHSLSGNASAFGNVLEVEIDDTLETEVYTTPATKGIEYETDPVANAKIGDMAGLTTTTKETLVKAINSVNSKAKANEESIANLLNGTTTTPKAKNAQYATTAENANHATTADNATNAQNSKKVNNLEVAKDTNGVLRIGGIIIPQKILLFSNAIDITNNATTITLNGAIKHGDALEFCFKDNNGYSYTEKCIVYNENSDDGEFLLFYFTHFSASGSQNGIDGLSIYSNGVCNSLKITLITGRSSKLLKIYKVIE